MEARVWKARVGGMDLSEARRLRALKDENAKLERVPADAMRGNVAPKAFRVKTW